jgi:hypothetical protein
MTIADSADERVAGRVASGAGHFLFQDEFMFQDEFKVDVPCPGRACDSRPDGAGGGRGA